MRMVRRAPILNGDTPRKHLEVPLKQHKSAKLQSSFKKNLLWLVLICLLLWKLTMWPEWGFPPGKTYFLMCRELQDDFNDPPKVQAIQRPKNASAPLLVLHACHGLSNRLRSLASAMAVASATGRQLQVIWILDEHIEARFQDLFDDDLTVWDSLEAVTSRPDWPTFDKYNYMANEEGAEKYKPIDDSSPNHIYVKSAYILRNGHSLLKDVSRELNSLTPSLAVRRHLAPFRSQACPGWAPCTSYIGVHVRSMNPHAELKHADENMYTKEAWETTASWRKSSVPEHFVSELRRVLKDKKSTQIFVSSDSQESLKPFLDEFGEHVLFLDKKGCFDRSPECIVLALADLLLLGYSSHDFILGSYWSSFTEVAAYVKSLDVKFAGIDFVAPGRHAMKCGVPKIDKSGAFNGVSVVVAAKDRQEVLAKNVPAWLSEESVSEVVLVDWNSQPPLNVALSFINDTRFRIVQVNGPDAWILTRAVNIGIRHSSAARILKLDTDTEMLPKFIEAHPLEAGVFYAGNWKLAKDENRRHLNGIFFAHRNDLTKINGFDERIETYGWDDEDIYARLENNGVKRKDLDLAYFRHLEHENFKRMQHSKSVSKCTDVEMLRNKNLLVGLPGWGPNSETTQLQCETSEEYTCTCEIDKMPSGLADLQPPSVVLNSTLAAYRTVVGYTGDFNKATLNEVDSLQWYETYLRRHFHTAAHSLIYVPQGSVGERLAGIDCARELAITWAFRFQVVWKTGKECNNSFEQLFGTTEFDISPELYPFELSPKYKVYYLDHGTDWLTDATPAPMGRHVVIASRGAFGSCPNTIPQDLMQSLAPTDLAAKLWPTWSSPPYVPVLLVHLQGTIVQRMRALAKTMQLGRRIERHVVFVWDPTAVGGLKPSDLLTNEFHVVASVDDYFREKGMKQHDVYKPKVKGNVAGMNWSMTSDILLEVEGQIEGVEVDEVELNKIVAALTPNQALVHEMEDLQRGRPFHGILVGDQWDHCHMEGAYAALKAEYEKLNLKGTAHLMLLVEKEELCREAGEGVLCVRMCGAKDDKACFMRHMAAVFVMGRLPNFFFFSWRHVEANFILRLNLHHSSKLDCSPAPKTDPGAAKMDMVTSLGARRLQS